jgi:hypothetical protein
MATQPQTPVGGLNQARPAPAPVTAAKPENLAVRASGMEQSEAVQPEDFFTKSMRDLQTQRESLNTQIKTLKESLDSRMGLPFDPMLLKVAAGFAKPTKTGSFGESMGYAAEAAVEEGEKEFARKQGINKLKLELDQKMLDLSQQNAIMGHRMSRLGGGAPAGGPVGGPVGGPAGGAAPAIAGRTPQGPSVPTPGAPPQAAPATQREPVMSTGAPRQQKLITDADIEQAYLLDPSGKYGKELAEIAKLQREDVKAIGNRPYSTSRQEFLGANPDEIVEVDFGRYIGNKKVPYSVYEEWKTFHDKANKEKDRNIEFDWFKSKGWMEGEPSTKPEGEKGAGPLTVDQRKAREALIQKRQEAQIGEEKTAISQIDTNMRSSRELVNTARDMKEIATTNPRAFELMNDEGIAAAVKRAAEKGLTTPGGSISIPSTELSSYKLSKEDREALQMFAQKYAQLTVQFRKAARVPGEGATTEREGDLYAQLGAMPTDTPKVIRLKSEFVELKGKYDQEVFKAWNKFSKNPENSYRDFLGSDDLSRVNEAYDKRLGEMRSANSELFRTVPKKEKPSAPAAPAAPQRPAAPTARPASTAPRPAASGRVPGFDDEAPPAASGIPPKVGTPAYKQLPEGKLFEDADGTIRRKPKGG